MNDDFKRGLITGLALQPLNVTFESKSGTYCGACICGVLSGTSYCKDINYEEGQDV